LRGFSETRIAEVIGTASAKLGSGTTTLEMIFDKPITTDDGYDRYQVEPWFVWSEDAPLALQGVPEPF
jgi:hypothetical protein